MESTVGYALGGDLQIMKILVTGGAGFVGSHLCEGLINQGHYVTCLDDLSSGSIWNIRHMLDHSLFRFANGSILDQALVDKVVADAEIVYHLAAQVHVDRSYIEPELTFDVNVKGTQLLLERSRWHRIAQFIYASSSEVYGTAQYAPMDEKHPLDAPHPYGASKIAADRLCFSYAKTYRMPITIVRCFNLFGPRQKDFGYGGVISLFMRKALREEPLVVFGKGLQSRDYLYVTDAVEFYIRAFNSRLHVGPWNVGTGNEVTVNDLADAIIARCGCKSKRVHIEPRQSEVLRLCCDPALARSAGWAPMVSLNEGLDLLYRWFQRNGTDR